MLGDNTVTDLSECIRAEDESDEEDYYAPTDGLWGPNRVMYEWDDVIDRPCFNSMLGNPKIRDERNFVRIREYGSDGEYSDRVEMEAGKQYEVGISFHNNCSNEFNKKPLGYGIAENVRIAVRAPQLVRGGSSARIQGIISSTNTYPRCVWDCCFAHTNSTVLCRYVPNSATLHVNGNADKNILSSKAMFGVGAKVAFWNDMWGSIPGGVEYSGYITYRFQVDQSSLS